MEAAALTSLQRLYDWSMRSAAHRGALPTLFLISLIEASIFPIPPDVLIIPMVLAARDRAWLIAGVATVGSVLGGFLGYGIGWGLFETIGRPILEFYGYAAKFERSEEHTSELQSRGQLVCRRLLEKEIVVLLVNLPFLRRLIRR